MRSRVPLTVTFTRAVCGSDCIISCGSTLIGRTVACSCEDYDGYLGFINETKLNSDC